MISFKVDDLRQMNGFLKEFLDYLESENVSEDCVFDSRLVSCELISNVLKHCGESAYFCGTLTGEEVVIDVHGDSPIGVLPRPALPPVFSESGRGLYIVNAVSDGNVHINGNKVTVIIKRK